MPQESMNQKTETTGRTARRLTPIEHPLVGTWVRVCVPGVGIARDYRRAGTATRAYLNANGEVMLNVCQGLFNLKYVEDR